MLMQRCVAKKIMERTNVSDEYARYNPSYRTRQSPLKRSGASVAPRGALSVVCVRTRPSSIPLSPPVCLAYTWEHRACGAVRLVYIEFFPYNDINVTDARNNVSAS